MNRFPVNFKETQSFHMYKQVLHRIDKARNVKDLARFVVIFGFEELKEIIKNKLNVEIEKGQKSENNIDFFAMQNKICDTYLYTSSLNEILPTTVQLYILSFLDHNSFENLSLLSKSFRRIFYLNPILFRKYTLKFGELNISGSARTRTNLWIEHKSSQVMIEAFPQKLDESVDNKSDVTVNAMNQLGQFPWHSIRKWHVDGIQLDHLYWFFMQKWDIMDNLFVKKECLKTTSKWKKKIKCIEEQLYLFIAMLNKAHKSIRALTVTDQFDQITVFPIFPNLVHLNLQDIKIGTCFKSINVKGLMPQLKTLKVKRLQIGLCKYCNWKQVIQAAELCDFDDSKPLGDTRNSINFGV
ncbi:hypothetical protein RFI_07413, partial [Reticulomyxa filosa]